MFFLRNINSIEYYRVLYSKNSNKDWKPEREEPTEIIKTK